MYRNKALSAQAEKNVLSYSAYHLSDPTMITWHAKVQVLNQEKRSCPNSQNEQACKAYQASQLSQVSSESLR